jgi:hypothetical protein
MKLLADRSEGGHVAARPCVRARCSNFPDKVALKGTPPITSLNYQNPRCLRLHFQETLIFPASIRLLVSDSLSPIDNST